MKGLKAHVNPERVEAVVVALHDAGEWHPLHRRYPRRGPRNLGVLLDSVPRYRVYP